MITIGKPHINQDGEQSFINTIVADSNSNTKFKLWYSVEHQYEQYLCHETVDSFLLVVLQLALSTGQDIKCEAPVSAKLLFHLRNSLIAMLCKVIPNSKPIKIFAQTSNLQFNASGVGCGCSLGVDSFSSLIRHLGQDVVDGYKVTHLTLFNTGQFGSYRLAEAEAAFKKNVEALKPFAQEIGLPIVAINTNLNELYLGYRVTLLQSFVQRTISAAMILQKLFGHYIYASSYQFDQIFYSSEDVSHAETAIVPLLSTNNMEVVLSNADLTRVEKTDMICRNSLVHKYLDVCWATQLSNMSYGSELLKGKTKKNCGKCDKCLRTLFTIELLGQLDNYSEIFDIDAYHQYRSKFIVKVLSMRKENLFYSEIYELMDKVGFKPTTKEIVLAFFVKMGVYRLAQRIFRISTMAH